jgi:hypothetical protein
MSQSDREAVGRKHDQAGVAGVVHTAWAARNGGTCGQPDASSGTCRYGSGVQSVSPRWSMSCFTASLANSVAASAVAKVVSSLAHRVTAEAEPPGGAMVARGAYRPVGSPTARQVTV